MNTASKEKIGVAVFGVFTLLFLFLGVGQIKKNLNPWQRPPTAGDKSIEDIQKDFGRVDTDGDGLTDILEQTLYETSAYLPDSDSDGIPDGVEIARGENPLCPFGQNCIRGTMGVSLAEPNLTVDLSGGVDTGRTESSNVPVKDLSADQIRQLLIEAGAPSEQIESLSDDQLKALYQETAQSNNKTEEEKIIQAFLSQDASQIRQILRDQGVPEDVLNNVSDEELAQVFANALQQGQ